MKCQNCGAECGAQTFCTECGASVNSTNTANSFENSTNSAATKKGSFFGNFTNLFLVCAIALAVFPIIITVLNHCGEFIECLFDEELGYFFKWYNLVNMFFEWVFVIVKLIPLALAVVFVKIGARKLTLIPLGIAFFMPVLTSVVSVLRSTVNNFEFFLENFGKYIEYIFQTIISTVRYGYFGNVFTYAAIAAMIVICVFALKSNNSWFNKNSKIAAFVPAGFALLVALGVIGAMPIGAIDFLNDRSFDFLYILGEIVALFGELITLLQQVCYVGATFFLAWWLTDSDAKKAR